jgi:hypothetical protein
MLNHTTNVLFAGRGSIPIGRLRTVVDGYRHHVKIIFNITVVTTAPRGFSPEWHAIYIHHEYLLDVHKSLGNWLFGETNQSDSWKIGLRNYG